MRFQDQLAEQAFKEIATLLAAAYQRYAAVRRVVSESPDETAPNGLDSSGLSSLHEQ